MLDSLQWLLGKETEKERDENRNVRVSRIQDLSILLNDVICGSLVKFQ